MADMPIWQALVLLVLSFYLLAKGASWLVDGGVGIAERLRVPKLVIGIVLVGLATSAPEFAVSFLSALAGKPELALGNVVGSNIVNDGVALALVGLLAAAPVVISRRVLLQAAAFILLIDVTAFTLVITNRADQDFVLSGWGGAILVGFFCLYLVQLFRDRRRHPDGFKGGELSQVEAEIAGKSLPASAGLFIFGLALVVGSSEVVVVSASRLAAAAHVPDAVIALSVIAIGTSIPEIATCVAAARKGQGALAVGNILGSDIFNIAGIAGASALANPLAVPKKIICFMFPSMLAVMLVTLGGLVFRGRMTRAQGAILLAMFVAYMVLMACLFPPSLG